MAPSHQRFRRSAAQSKAIGKWYPKFHRHLPHIGLAVTSEKSGNMCTYHCEKASPQPRSQNSTISVALTNLLAPLLLFSLHPPQTRRINPTTWKPSASGPVKCFLSSLPNSPVSLNHASPPPPSRHISPRLPEKLLQRHTRNCVKTDPAPPPRSIPTRMDTANLILMRTSSHLLGASVKHRTVSPPKPILIPDFKL